MTTFVHQQPQPGDGQYLLRPEGKQRNGRRRKGKRSSFLLPQQSQSKYHPADPAATGSYVTTAPLRKQTPGHTREIQRQSVKAVHRRLTHQRTISPVEPNQLLSMPMPMPMLSVRSAESPPEPGSKQNLAAAPPHTLQPKPCAPANSKGTSKMLSATATLTKAIPPHLRPRPSPGASTVHTNKQQPDDARKDKPLLVNLSIDTPKTTSKEPSSPQVSHHRIDAGGPKTKPYENRGGSETRGHGVPIRGRQSAGRGKAPRDARWPTKHDFPKIDAKRWETDWFAHDKSPEEASFASGCADSGLSDKKWKDAGWDESNTKLTSWDANWAPPAFDWDNRPGFRPDQSAQQIEQWLDYVLEGLTGVDPVVPTGNITTGDDILYCFSTPIEPSDHLTLRCIGDIIPRHWIPIVMGRQAPQTFWNELMKSNAPKPVDPNDLENARPWWSQVVKGYYFLEELAAPEIAGISPDETSNERLAREADLGSAQHAENRSRFERAKTDVKAKARHKAQDKAKRISEKYNEQSKRLHKAPILPKVNLFLRSANADDLREIQDIFNHYVEFTSNTPETQPQSIEDLTDMYHSVIISRLPFIVAVEPGQVLRQRKKDQQGERIQLPDKIIGIALAEDYGHTRGMYRYSVEARVFVHKEYYMKGVGNCLMDKLMGLLDPDYPERGGYTVVGDELDAGPVRFITNVMVNYSFDNSHKLEWMSRWLENWLSFVPIGRLDAIGTKNGKPVSLAIFQRTTGAVLNHGAPPSITMGSPKP